MISHQLISLFVTLSFFFWALFMVLSIIKGAPFIRSTKKRISGILDLAEAATTDRVLDLGSGDGSIPIAFAQKGIRADGCEINFFLVVYSRIRAQLLHLDTLSHFYWGNMWRYDTGGYSVVTVYGFPSIMADLEKKLLKELAPGSRVISNSFQFPNWKAERVEGSLFLYIVPSSYQN